MEVIGCSTATNEFCCGIKELGEFDKNIMIII